MAAAVPYVQTLGFEFINYDDHAYVYENKVLLDGLSLKGMVWALTSLQVGHWVPLTGLSHMLDCDLYRQADGSQWAGGHHMTNVVLHIANTLALFFAMHLLFGAAALWRSALVAALFAVHPTHVESVAWISERKDVLSTLFGFLAIVGYAWYVRRPSAQRYSVVFACMALSLLAKPMFVTLPCVLLLLDIWPLRRWRIAMIDANESSLAPHSIASIQRILVEKIPLFLLSIAASVIAVVTQSTVGATAFGEQLSVVDRFANAIVAYASYLLKLIAPTDLALIYPHPKTWPATTVIACGIVLIIITAIAIIARHRRPWLLIGWLMFLGMFVPVIGVVQTSAQFMADRYLYVPATGVFIMIAWSIPHVQARAARIATAVVCGVVIGALMIGATAQASYWKDSRTLFTRVLEVTEKNVMAHLLLGKALMDDGEVQSAIAEIRLALEIEPNQPESREILANALLATGESAEAAEHLRAAMELRPSEFASHHLGLIYLSAGQLRDAEQMFRINVELDGDNSSRARENLAMVLIQQSRMTDAQPLLEEAIRLTPDSAHAHNGLGIVHLSNQNLPAAKESLSRALELNPADMDCRGNLGWVLTQLGQYDAAIEHLSHVKSVHPERFGVRTNLARALAMSGKTDTAIEELNAILSTSPQFEPARTVLAELTEPSNTP